MVARGGYIRHLGVKKSGDWEELRGIDEVAAVCWHAAQPKGQDVVRTSSPACGKPPFLKPSTGDPAMNQRPLSRRHLLRGGLAIGALALFTPGVFAEQLARTPSMTEGPFYPDKLPLDTDNDLIVVSDSITPAVGEITHLTGRVLDAGGEPIKDALIEIWQCDAKGVYIHTSDSVPNGDRQDKHFQGYGRFTTASSGEYRFRTIKPVPYPGRPAPHIHVKIKKAGRELLTTQLFVAGYAGNARDNVYRGVRDLVDRELVSADFKPIKGSKTGELAAQFDIVIGRTPADQDHDHH
jgi:protocatechuate 3,4-dioxygenase beta subunit